MKQPGGSTQESSESHSMKQESSGNHSMKQLGESTQESEGSPSMKQLGGSTQTSSGPAGGSSGKNHVQVRSHGWSGHIASASSSVTVSLCCYCVSSGFITN